MLMEQLEELAAALRGRSCADGAAGGTLGRFAALGGDGDDDDDDDEASQALDDAVAQVDKLQALLTDLDPRWAGWLAGGVGLCAPSTMVAWCGLELESLTCMYMHADLSHACTCMQISMPDAVMRDLSHAWLQPAGMSGMCKYQLADHNVTYHVMAFGDMQCTASPTPADAGHPPWCSFWDSHKQSPTRQYHMLNLCEAFANCRNPQHKQGDLKWLQSRLRKLAARVEDRSKKWRELFGKHLGTKQQGHHKQKGGGGKRRD